MNSNRLRLGVNIDHVATVRQARGTRYPSVTDAAAVCEGAGADGITIHLREDRRHIQDQDLYDLIDVVKIPLNLELANEEKILEIALRSKPHEVCIVPERREELTTEGGLDVVRQHDSLARTIARLKDAGILVSLFIEPSESQIEASSSVRADCVELHTGTYCDSEPSNTEKEMDRLIAGAGSAHNAGLVVNAGHGINMDNLQGILRIPHLDTLNIGHSLVARAIFVGLADSVQEMFTGMSAYAGGEAGE